MPYILMVIIDIEDKWKMLLVIYTRKNISSHFSSNFLLWIIKDFLLFHEFLWISMNF